MNYSGDFPASWIIVFHFHIFGASSKHTDTSFLFSVFHFWFPVLLTLSLLWEETSKAASKGCSVECCYWGLQTISCAVFQDAPFCCSTPAVCFPVLSSCLVLWCSVYVECIWFLSCLLPPNSGSHQSSCAAFLLCIDDAILATFESPLR